MRAAVMQMALDEWSCRSEAGRQAVNKPLRRRGNLLRVGLDSRARAHHQRAASSCEKVSRAKACAHTIPVNGMDGKVRPSNEHAAIIHALPMTPN